MGYVGGSQIKILKARCAGVWQAVCQKIDCCRNKGSRNRTWDHLSRLKSSVRALERGLLLARISDLLRQESSKVATLITHEEDEYGQTFWADAARMAETYYRPRLIVYVVWHHIQESTSTQG